MKQYSKDEIRAFFEMTFSGPGKPDRYSNGDYTTAENRAAWRGYQEGFQEGFEKYTELANKPGLGYIAIRENRYNTNLWVVTLKTLYDDKSRINPFMDNEYLDLSLPNFHQNYNNTFRYLGMGDGDDKLVKLGFEVINDPKYRFTYEPKDKDLPRGTDY